MVQIELTVELHKNRTGRSAIGRSALQDSAMGSDGPHPVTLELTGPEGVVHKGPVRSATIRLAQAVSEFGCGCNSEGCMTSFGRGVLTFIKDGRRSTLRIGEGFASIRANRLTIVTQKILPASARPRAAA